MKKVITLLILFISLNSFGQTWAESGAAWHYSYVSIVGEGYSNVYYVSDTTLLGIQSKKFSVSDHYYNQVFGYFENYFKGYEYTYADSNHVYHYINGEFKILYDFSAQVGDTLTHYLYSNLLFEECDSIGRSIVSEIGTININGEDLRWYEVEYLNGLAYLSGRVIEKVGCIGFMFPDINGCVVTEEASGPLRCYEDDNFELYINPEYEGECDFIYEFPIPNYFNNDPEWCVNYANGFGDPCTDVFEEVQYIDGTIVIDSVTYYKLYVRGLHSGYDNSGTFPSCNFSDIYYNYLYVFLRQEGREIYLKVGEDEPEFLLYDFSLSVGDTLTSDDLNGDQYDIFPEYDGPHVITSIDSIIVDNNYYKRFFFITPNSQIGDEPEYVIEGIGHYRGFLHPYALFVNFYYYLSAFKKSEIIQYEFTESEVACDFALSIDENDFTNVEILLYPNPVNNTLQLNVSEYLLLKNIRIYALSGKLILELSPRESIDVSDLKSGMYLLEVESVDGYREVKRFVVE